MKNIWFPLSLVLTAFTLLTVIAAPNAAAEGRTYCVDVPGWVRNPRAPNELCANFRLADPAREDPYVTVKLLREGASLGEWEYRLQYEPEYSVCNRHTADCRVVTAHYELDAEVDGYKIHLFTSLGLNSLGASVITAPITAP